ncbi:PadR family transcriptional regulator [Streptomyces sp. IB2014 016-6]|uniref:PadR family transcriptional regulator n=1 Tax=Streptomyces sp. IB2014 016-6 TaxID=2517818 RepID=UPI0011C71150|nr:PadR family transcriptional regulator [Streptomyces sp. IB2014 016-6]TXL88633.1 PadR family transcriptional regulator [Streptomyces sp. IB2014 016-6]
MSLPHAILTALLERPSSGLELTRRFDRSIGYFWSATHQQIYRELGRLEESGYIRALAPEQPARGRKKEYEVLPAGRDELTGWVASREDPKPVRDPLLLRMRAAAVVGTDGLPVELRRHLALHERQLAEYRDIEARDFSPGPGPGREPGSTPEPGPEPAPKSAPRAPRIGGLSEADRLRHLVLRAGIDLERMWVQWLTEALHESDTAPAGGPDGTESS